MSRNPLFNLLSQGNSEAVRELLLTDQTLIHGDPFGSGSYAIHFAARGPDTPANIEMVKVLLSHGANVNSRDSGLWLDPPLLIASMMGRSKMCELLLTNGARYDLTLDNGWVSHALHQAQGVEVIKALIR